MHYSDILLFQGADQDGINDATARLMGLLHGLNRANGEQGHYPLSVAFPRWQAPSLHADKRLSSGTTGPILRLFGPEPLLHEFIRHKLVNSLSLEGRAHTDKLLPVLADYAQWVSYRRYNAKEKQFSSSYSRRVARRRALKVNSVSHESTEKPESVRIKPFINLKILRHNHPLVVFPVVEQVYLASDKPDKHICVNSWGLLTDGVLPYF